MEQLLQYVWKYKMYAAHSLTTVTGQTISVLDAGIHNTDAGPDFFNAKVKIDNTVWVGNVEIHHAASCWRKHGHDTNRIYDSVILHVVNVSDISVYRTNGELIPQLILQIPESIQRNYAYLLQKDSDIPCLDRIHEIDTFDMTSWMEALLCERLDRKTNDIFKLLYHYSYDWNEAFYITLTRNFGFGTNNDAMELLAKSLPLRYLLKHRNNVVQTEALIFGQAGMLNEQYPDAYYRNLQQEYSFLRHKFNLHPIDDVLYKSLRIRPASFPHIRLAQIAALWMKHDTFFSSVLEAADVDSVRLLLRIEPSVYWQTHYHFRYASIKKTKITGNNALDILIINTVIPMIFAYGIRIQQPEYTEKAMAMLEDITAENNHITATFRHAGLFVKHAGDSQALIQLKRAYCENKKCLYCRIGFKLLQKK